MRESGRPEQEGESLRYVRLPRLFNASMTSMLRAMNDEAVVQLKKVFGKVADRYTDDQLTEISRTLDALAELFIDSYLSQSDHTRETRPRPKFGR